MIKFQEHIANMNNLLTVQYSILREENAGMTYKNYGTASWLVAFKGVGASV